MSPTAIKEEVFELNQSVAGISATNISVVTGEGMQVIWEYEVPVGYSLLFRQEDHFAAYMEVASEADAASLLDIVISDASRVAIRPILNQIRYAQARGSASTFLAFQDEDYFNYLDLSPGEIAFAREGERVLVRGNMNAVLVVASCYFHLTCKRVRHTLFE